MWVINILFYYQNLQDKCAVLISWLQSLAICDSHNILDCDSFNSRSWQRSTDRKSCRFQLPASPAKHKYSDWTEVKKSFIQSTAAKQYNKDFYSAHDVQKIVSRETCGCDTLHRCSASYLTQDNPHVLIFSPSKHLLSGLQRNWELHEL